MFYNVIGGIVLAQVLAPENFNRFIDYLAPVYLLLVTLLVIVFARNSTAAAAKKDRVYAVKKKQPQGKEISWKQKFIGVWEKIERPGFKEVGFDAELIFFSLD